MAHNIKYYKDIIFSFQIKLPLLWAGCERFESAILLKKYWALALRVNVLEKKVVPDYGCLPSLDSSLSWNADLEHWCFVENATPQVLNEKVEEFNSNELSDWELVMV